MNSHTAPLIPADPQPASRASAWWKDAIALPFLITRLAWLLTGALAWGTLAPNVTYLDYFKRGGFLTRIFWLDIFAHWDAKYYLAIAQQGYQPSADFTQRYTALAFFPLYPYLVRSVGWLGVHLPDSAVLFIGILFSNLCFLIGVLMVYRIATRQLALPDQTARRALLLLFAFPTSFFFGSFYTESLFFALSALAFWLAFDQRWWLASLAAAAAVLTRNQGLMVAAVLPFVYLAACGWQIRRIRLNILWFALPGVALLAHLLSLYPLTGSFLAPYLAQYAWGRGTQGPLAGILAQLAGASLDVFKTDAVLLILFVICALWLIAKCPPRLKLLGAYALGLCLMPIATGSLVSVGRFLLVIFPVFLLLADKLPTRLYQILLGVFFAMQILFFAAWSLFYWVG